LTTTDAADRARRPPTSRHRARAGQGPRHLRARATVPVSDGSVPTHRQILRILPGLILALSLATLNQTMVTLALPTIVGEFHRSDLLAWLVSAYGNSA